MFNTDMRQNAEAVSVKKLHLSAITFTFFLLFLMSLLVSHIAVITFIYAELSLDTSTEIQSGKSLDFDWLLFVYCWLFGGKLACFILAWNHIVWLLDSVSAFRQMFSHFREL